MYVYIVYELHFLMVNGKYLEKVRRREKISFFWKICCGVTLSTPSELR